MAAIALWRRLDGGRAAVQRTLAAGEYYPGNVHHTAWSAMRVRVLAPETKPMSAIR
jgi:hypothetical protein